MAVEVKAGMEKNQRKIEDPKKKEKKVKIKVDLNYFSIQRQPWAFSLFQCWGGGGGEASEFPSWPLLKRKREWTIVFFRKERCISLW